MRRRDRRHEAAAAFLPPPPSCGRVGVGVVPSCEDRVELNRRRPTLTLPRLGGGNY
jgi:hypothetical protein